jgi:hypothetical protein
LKIEEDVAPAAVVVDNCFLFAARAVVAVANDRSDSTEDEEVKEGEEEMEW